MKTLLINTNKKKEGQIFNKLRRSITLVLCILLIGIYTGCKKLVNVAPPVTQLVTTSVFANDASAIAAQLGVYAHTNMAGLPVSIDQMSALSADELKSFTTSLPARDIYLNALSASKDPSGAVVAQDFWGIPYNFIYQENAIIENVTNSSSITPSLKPLMTGEARFMRAYFYFYLVNFYGDVPLVTTTNYAKNSIISRSPQEDVYQQMFSDLTAAKNSLSSKFIDASDTTATTARIRPTTWAASALLARVKLYHHDYADAETESTRVINNTSLFNLPSDLNTVFLANSSESIWQLAPATSSSAPWAREASAFILTTKPGTGTSASAVLSAQLMAAFETGDKRFSSWVGAITVSGTTYNFPYKYKNKTTAGEYSTLLRLAEQYLIRAEARAQQNKLNEAVSDVNVIRSRAGLNPLASNLTKDQVLSAIAQERRVELFTEGHRWFDLKRTGTVDAVMGAPGNATQAKGGSGWQPYQALYPIPFADLNNDQNLTQTPGY